MGQKFTKTTAASAIIMGLFSSSFAGFCRNNKNAVNAFETYNLDTKTFCNLLLSQNRNELNSYLRIYSNQMQPALRQLAGSENSIKQKKNERSTALVNYVQNQLPNDINESPRVKSLLEYILQIDLIRMYSEAKKMNCAVLSSKNIIKTLKKQFNHGKISHIKESVYELKIKFTSDKNQKELTHSMVLYSPNRIDTLSGKRKHVFKNQAQFSQFLRALGQSQKSIKICDSLYNYQNMPVTRWSDKFDKKEKHCEYFVYGKMVTELYINDYSMPSFHQLTGDTRNFMKQVFKNALYGKPWNESLDRKRKKTTKNSSSRLEL